MRIVIDMQGMQSTGSRNRGIGRYTSSLVKAFIRNRGEHEVILALSGLFPDTIESIRTMFADLLPKGNIRVWYAPVPVSVSNMIEQNYTRRNAAELIREAFLNSLNPSIILVTSLFEGLGDDAVTSVGSMPSLAPTAVVLYDLIPFIHQQPYLENSTIRAWYLNKVEHLRRADLLLSISESSRQEAIEHLGFSEKNVFNISTAADPHFQTRSISDTEKKNLEDKYDLRKAFVMYTGGIDYRKNIEKLIEAYAQLPFDIREDHQLAIVCSIQEAERQRLMNIASSVGLKDKDLILTGYVPENDLVSLYNLCKAFIFPSWHEGFGLPALEAMSCGKAVIGSNVSSIPEVIGEETALFDPHAQSKITLKLQQVLTDDNFRTELEHHATRQAKKFSWNNSAKKAIHAIEKYISEHERKSDTILKSSTRPRLAYVSPLPPQRSGISDYSSELLPHLAKFYDIEVIVDQEVVADAWINKNCTIRNVEWFRRNSNYFDRVLYHFGNSHFHQYMFDLLSDIPGVVVLHDFYLSNVLHHMEIMGHAPRYFTEQLYYSHGYAGLSFQAKCDDLSKVIWHYPCSRSVINNSIGTIVHSFNSVLLAQRWYGDNGLDLSVIPLLREPASVSGKLEIRKELGLADEDFVVCSFGMLGPAKLNHRLLQAWFDSELAKSKQCCLIFVGENHSGDYGNELISKINRCPYGSGVLITGWVTQDTFRKYLAAADVGVQLRTLSRGETSAAVLDCMNYGLATIVNSNGSMADLEDGAIWKLPDDFKDKELTHALEFLWRDSDCRKQLGAKAKDIILDKHAPTHCAEQYETVIETYYSRNTPMTNSLLSSIKDSPSLPSSHSELMTLAQAIAETFPPIRAPQQLLVDISELAQRDAKTGIQRVVRNVLKEWLNNPPSGWLVEPVYATIDQSYRYARKFTTEFLDVQNDGLNDDSIDYAPGDVFFGLDLQPQVQTSKREFYQHLRQQGVTVKFMVYDLLCLQQPEHFTSDVSEGFMNWLMMIGETDGAVCISRAVADELSDWLKHREWNRFSTFMNDWCHLGANLDSSVPAHCLPSGAEQVFANINQRPSFLVVGTIEPRKGIIQVLDAFEHLWQKSTQINLVIVGKQGWMVENLVEKLRCHPEHGNRLFWLEGISDEYLEKAYAVSTCLIAASNAEGFGLPLIEAAQHKLPIIARDIPVFREVAGDYAYYFSGNEPESLESAVEDWLELYNEELHPKSDDMPWLSWEESAQQLLNILLKDDMTTSEHATHEEAL